MPDDVIKRKDLVDVFTRLFIVDGVCVSRIVFEDQDLKEYFNIDPYELMINSLSDDFKGENDDNL